MKKPQKQALAASVSAAAIAAAAAGVYFLIGKRGAKNRKKIGLVADKIKRDVVKELKSLEKAGRPAYNQAVDSVAKRYRQLQNVDKNDVAAAVSELKSHWNSIARQIKQAGRQASKTPKTKKRAKAKSGAAKKRRK